MKLKFSIPEGFEMPPDADVGGEFSAVGTFLDNGDGTLTLVQIDGADVGEMVHDMEDGEDEEGEEGYGMGKGKGHKGPPKAKLEIEMEGEGAESLFAKAKKAGVPMKM